MSALSSYQLSNLIGTTFQSGNLQFTPDGNALLSPVGNRISVIDLIQGCTCTLTPENTVDIKILALSPDAKLLLSIDLQNNMQILNFVHGCVLSQQRHRKKVRSARWSPNGSFFGVALENTLQIMRAPSISLGWKCVIHAEFREHTDYIIDLGWSPDSQFVSTCSKDQSVRLWSVSRHADFQEMVLVEHRSPVCSVFFSSDMYYLFSISRDGVVAPLKWELAKPAIDKEKSREKLLYLYPGTWKVKGRARMNWPAYRTVTCASFHAPTNVLAVGSSEGVYSLFELPEMEVLQTMSLGKDPIDSIMLGASGDWLAVGSKVTGQLLVWEWRSETYILKQQGHHYGVQCVAFSPAGRSSMARDKAVTSTDSASQAQAGNALSGRLLATGGYDGKVKLFNSQNGLCFVTFAEHTAAISGVCFTPQGNAVFSASQDGSVRGFDLLRYRNFRTFVSPDGLCQFGGIAVDSGGEIVAANSVGGNYSIYVWSIQTGSVLEVLTGHTANVQCVQFAPPTSRPGILVSGSWDHTLRVWDLFAGKGSAAEKLECSSSVTCAVFDPRGNDICAAACLHGQILFWNVGTGTQTGTLDGLRDIQSGRRWHDQFSSANVKRLKRNRVGKLGPSDGLNLNQHFNSLAYARNGESLLCSSKDSPQVYLYNTTSLTLISRLVLTHNQSLSGVNQFLSKKCADEYGQDWHTFDVSDSEDEVSRKVGRKRQRESLPGVSVGEAKDMYTERELHVWGVAMSPDSQNFAVATTHGVFFYTSDSGMGSTNFLVALSNGFGNFSPQMLTPNVTMPAILKVLEEGDLPRAMILALALSDKVLLRRVYEAVPAEAVPVIVGSIGAPLLPALIWFLASELRSSTGTPHYQLHICWVTALLDLHLTTLLEMASGKSSVRTGATLETAMSSRSDVGGLCLQLLLELSQSHAALSQTFNTNTYFLRYLSHIPDNAETSQVSVT